MQWTTNFIFVVRLGFGSPARRGRGKGLTPGDRSGGRGLIPGDKASRAKWDTVIHSTFSQQNEGSQETDLDKTKRRQNP